MIAFFGIFTVFGLRNAKSTHIIAQPSRAVAAGCPGPTRFLDGLENILYSSRKISDDLLFSRSPNFFTFLYQLSNFTRIRSLDAPPVLHHAPVTTFFNFFLVIYLHFLRKQAPWMPPGWMPGA